MEITQLQHAECCTNLQDIVDLEGFRAEQAVEIKGGASSSEKGIIQCNEKDCQ